MPSAGLYYMGSFSWAYVSSAGLRVEFLLHTPCWLVFLGVSLIRPMPASLCREFLVSSFQNKKTKCKC